VTTIAAHRAVIARRRVDRDRLAVLLDREADLVVCRSRTRRSHRHATAPVRETSAWHPPDRTPPRATRTGGGRGSCPWWLRPPGQRKSGLESSTWLCAWARGHERRPFEHVPSRHAPILRQHRAQVPLLSRTRGWRPIIVVLATIRQSREYGMHVGRTGPRVPGPSRCPGQRDRSSSCCPRVATSGQLRRAEERRVRSVCTTNVRLSADRAGRRLERDSVQSRPTLRSRRRSARGLPASDAC